jgi:acyl-CoA synthetase (NDP forming)
VKKDGRDSLTAPEGKLVCDAYGIPVPKEGVATSAAEAMPRWPPAWASRW